MSATTSNRQSSSLLYLFFLLSFINLIAEFQHWQLLIYLSKPLLMISLSSYFYQQCQNQSTFSQWIFRGFLFSILGDTFLMFVEGQSGSPSFFLWGLGSFLLTHLCYTMAFLNYPDARKGWVAQHKWAILPALIFLLSNLYYLWPDLPNAFRPAVVCYSTVIIGMAICCLNLKGKIDGTSFSILLTGVLLFILSDSIISLNKFKSAQLSLPYPRLLIMLTYLSGQYLIAKASIGIHQNLNDG